MAQENTQADYQEIEFKKRARRRLVGSIALVLILIVFLPMLLEDKHNPDPQQGLTTTFPPEQSNPVETAPLESPVNQPETTQQNTSPAQPSAAHPNPENSSTEKTSATDTAAQNTAGLMIQVGVFSDSANVTQLQSKLETNGFKVNTSALENGKTRLRVGPYASKAEADAAMAKLQSLKFNPMVVND